MSANLIIAGVGGQGILSVAWVLDQAAVAIGVNFQQHEIHGMSQRGGAVVAHLRLSGQPVPSGLVPKGKADLILSTEPLEAVRYLDYLGPGGAVVSSTEPRKNLAGYPELEPLLAALRAVPRHRLVPAQTLARKAGSVRAQTMVLLGAAAEWLPLPQDALESAVARAFKDKGRSTLALNLAALQAGRAAVAEEERARAVRGA